MTGRTVNCPTCDRPHIVFEGNRVQCVCGLTFALPNADAQLSPAGENHIEQSTIPIWDWIQDASQERLRALKDKEQKEG